MSSGMEISTAKQLVKSLIEPSDQVLVVAERRRARLLSALLIFTLAMFVLGVLISKLSSVMFAFAFVTIAYGLSRTRHYQWGALLAGTALVIPSFAVVLMASPEALSQAINVFIPLSWLIIALILASLWIKVWLMSIIVVLSIGSILSLIIIRPEINRLGIQQTVVLLLMASGLLLLASVLRNRDFAEIETQTKDIEEQKLVIQSNAQRYRELIETISDIVYRTDIKGYFNYVSPSAAILTGYSEQELLRMHFTDLVAPSSRQTVLDFYSNQLRDAKQESLLAFPIHSKDGTLHWVEQKIILMLSEDDKVRGFQGVVRDISERQQSEKKLRALYTIMAQTNLSIDKQLSQALQIGTEILGLDLGIISHIENDRYTVLYAHSPDNALQKGQTFSFEKTYCEMAYQANDLVSIEHMQDSVHKGHPCYAAFGLESYVGMPLFINGQRFGTLNFSSASPRKSRFTEVERDFFMLMAQWISATLERKFAEERLKNSETNLRSILDNTPAIIMKVNAQHEIEFIRAPEIDPALTEVMVGQNALVFVPEDYHSVVINTLQRVFSEQTSMHYETIGIDPRDGQPRTYLTNAAPIVLDGQTTAALLISNDITARVQLERQLRTSETLYKSTSDNVPGVIFQCLPDYSVWTMQYISNYVEQLTGYPVSEFIEHKRPFASLIHPDDNQIVNDKVEPAIESGSPYVVEYRIIHRDGHLLWVREQGQIINQHSETPLLVGIISDITERITSEKRLKQRDAILEAVAFFSEQLLAHPDWQAVIPSLLSRLGTETDASRVYIFQRHPDSPEDAVMVKQVYEWVAEGIPAEIDNPELQNFPMGEIFPQWVKNVSQRKNIYSHANEFPAGSVQRAVIDSQGIQSVLVMPIWVNNTWWGVIGFDECTGQRIWTQTEIDALQSAINNLGSTIERQERETQLRDAYELLNEAQKIGRMGNWEWNIRTGALHWSDEIYLINGREPRSIEPSYEGWLAFIHPDERALVQRSVEQALTGKPYDIESRIVLPDGSIRYAQNRGAVVFDEQGQPIKMKGITLDITERKSIEQQIQAQNESLVKANREIAVARKQAEAANRLKSQFLATMSHELRTPLNAVIGYSQLQLAGMIGELNEEQQSFQERILANAQHLLQLINEVLDLSKIEAGRLELAEKPFDLYELLNEIMVQNQVLARNKSLVFELSIDERLPHTLLGDRGRIKQIIINLVSNAIKFTDKGLITVEATLHDKQNWRIRVTDTGIGISSTMQETIFDEFRQAENGIDRGGTGLGLAIVRKLTLMMGGNVRVSSEIGQGSAFTITLPIITEAKYASEALEV